MEGMSEQRALTRVDPQPTRSEPNGPLLGFFRGFRRDPIGTLMAAHREHGDLVRFQGVGRQVLLGLHPEAAGHVLQENHRGYDKQSVGYDKLKLALGQGLLTSEGDFWRRQRRIVQPAFHRERLHRFGEVMADETVAMLDRWAEPAARGEPIDAAAEMMRLTVQIIGRTMFSRVLTRDAGQLGEMMSTAIQYINRRMTSWTNLFSFPEKLPTPANRRFRAAIRAGDEMVREAIAERRADTADRGDLLSMLMAMRDEETGEGMDDRQLRDEVITIFAAGHETTANALAWTWVLLSRGPEVARRLRAEVDQVLGGRAAGADDVPKLRYTQMVVKEAMRLYPPAWVISRRALAADTIMGQPVAPGTVVLVSPYVTQRHLGFWDNPEGFDPERFADGAGPRHRYAYFPFGGGPRLCVGNGFAMMEAQIILATVAQRFDVSLVPGHPIEMDPLVTLRPRHGVRVLLKRR